jgi:hypothetical protein
VEEPTPGDLGRAAFLISGHTLDAVKYQTGIRRLLNPRFAAGEPSEECEGAPGEAKGILSG